MDPPTLDEAADFVRLAWPDAAPRLGLICGSGWSEVIGAFEVRSEISYDDLPGMGKPGVIGHAGTLSWGTLHEIETLIFQGRRHYYEGEGWTPVGIPPRICSRLGVSHLVLTNSAGGIREGFSPGDLMIIRDHINFMGSNPLIGPHVESWGTRFPDQSYVYDADMRAVLRQAGTRAGVELQEGVYLARSGPVYETPAEIQAFQRLGADAVGMSTIPEAILATAAGLRVTGISCITNLAAGISAQALTHTEVTDTTAATIPKMCALLKAFWEELAE